MILLQGIKPASHDRPWPGVTAPHFFTSFLYEMLAETYGVRYTWSKWIPSRVGPPAKRSATASVYLRRASAHATTESAGFTGQIRRGKDVQNDRTGKNRRASHASVGRSCRGAGILPSLGCDDGDGRCFRCRWAASAIVALRRDERAERRAHALADIVDRHSGLQ